MSDENCGREEMDPECRCEPSPEPDERGKGIEIPDDMIREIKLPRIGKLGVKLALDAMEGAGCAMLLIPLASMLVSAAIVGAYTLMS